MIIFVFINIFYSKQTNSNNIYDSFNIKKKIQDFKKKSFKVTQNKVKPCPSARQILYKNVKKKIKFFF